MIAHFAQNDAGRDFVVGDIHGCFTRLQEKLDEIGFDPAADRLFSVGDLVDRGPESEQSLEWLNKPWFHAVRGNHEQMAIDHCAGMSDSGMYAQNGGAWMLGKTKAEAQQYADAFSVLPIAIEVQTKGGIVGIVHADCPLSDWLGMGAALSGPYADSFAQACIWNRNRITNKDYSAIENVVAVIVGHTPVQECVTLGNVFYIDTGAVFGRELTIIQIH